jgi:Tfp pilus assembly protein FimT
MVNRVRRLGIVIAVVAVLVPVAIPAFAQPDHATGLERAREVAAEGIEVARGLAQGPNADRATGLERAAQAIAAAMERGNGRGHAWGRGNSAAVHDIKANGGSPAAAGNHGQAVREMVQAYNALRKEAAGS